MFFTVGIPVGPGEVYKRYLSECLESIADQTYPADEILLIDDMAHLPEIAGTRIVKNPWLCGPTHSQNFAVALAKNIYVLLIGSDDKLMPWCLEDCRQTILKYPDPLGYYWCDVEYSTGERQSLPCGGAVVSKSLWKHCGGYPYQSAVGANDSILISIFLHNANAGHLIHVESKEPPIWARVNPESVTGKTLPGMQSAIFTVRQQLTEHWSKPTW
jgi:cellulose synthase/poly-beta-1,6-N-acetylglucosamine synthase-like glycosyltransferase